MLVIPNSRALVGTAERRLIAMALLLYGVVQVNAILHHGAWGQDFEAHLRTIARAYQDPWRFLTTYVEGQNNPPLYHLLCAGVFHLTSHVHSLEVIALLTAL